MEATRKEKLHIVMFPWMAFGHINPYIHLSNKLSSQGIQISFLSIPGNIPQIKTSLNLSYPNRVIPLNIPPVKGLSPDFDSTCDITPTTTELLKVALDLMQPQVKDILSQLQPQVVIFDFAQSWIPQLASNLGIKAVNFSTFPAVCNAFFTVPSRMTNLDEPPTIEELKKPPSGFPTSITSLKTFQVKDFQYLYRRFHGGLSVLDRIMKLMQSCDALALKACTEMEGPYIDYLRAQIAKPYLLTGPVVPPPPSDALDEKWAKWLDQFPEKSVIFCNFGTENHLTDAQINELTLGLELTQLPFFLVLNFGVSAADAQAAKLKAALPKEFRERVKDRGVVHVGWVQQRHILAHKNVGCFITHAGYNSMIEGMASEAQLVALPVKGDQFLNAKVISDDLKIGVEVNTRDEDGYFGKDDIVKAVNTVMVDVEKEPAKSIRENRRKWREFLLNKEIEEGYIAKFAKDLKDLAFS